MIQFNRKVLVRDVEVREYSVTAIIATQDSSSLDEIVNNSQSQAILIPVNGWVTVQVKESLQRRSATLVVADDEDVGEFFYGPAWTYSYLSHGQN